MANKAAANKAKNAGNVNFKNGKYEEALKNYDDAVRHDPEEVIYFKSQSIDLYRNILEFRNFRNLVKNCHLFLQLPQIFTNELDMITVSRPPTSPTVAMCSSNLVGGKKLRKTSAPLLRSTRTTQRSISLLS